MSKETETLELYTADYHVSVPDILSCQFDVTGLSDLEQRMFVEDLQDELRRIDEKWAKGKVKGSGKRIIQFLAKEPTPQGGYVRRVRVKFIPYPQSIINRVNRVREAVYSESVKYSLSPSPIAAGEEKVEFLSGNPVMANEKPRYLSKAQIFAVMRAVERINAEEVAEVNKSIEEFEKSADFESIANVVKKHLGADLAKGRRYPQVRVVFSAPTVFLDEFYEKVSQELKEAKEQADVKRQEMLKKMLEDIEAERNAMLESLRRSLMSRLRESLAVMEKGKTSGRKTYYEAAKKSVEMVKGFDTILGEEEVVSELIQLIDAEMKGDEKTASDLREKLVHALSEETGVRRAVKAAVDMGAEEEKKPRERKAEETALEELFGL
jgi:hypothetical protein